MTLNKEKFIEDVKLRLKGFGFTVYTIPGASDESFIEFSYEKVMNQIKHRINWSSIPKGLYEIAVDCVVGEYLYTKFSLGLLKPDDAAIDINMPGVKRVQDGDTTVEYAYSKDSAAATDPAIKFASFLDYLRRGSNTDFTHYRRMLW